jgi:hypothetical protein
VEPRPLARGSAVSVAPRQDGDCQTRTRRARDQRDAVSVLRVPEPLVGLAAAASAAAAGSFWLRHSAQLRVPIPGRMPDLPSRSEPRERASRHAVSAADGQPREAWRRGASMRQEEMLAWNYIIEIL